MFHRVNRAVMSIRRFQNIANRPMESDRLKHQQNEIDVLTKELNQIVDAVTITGI